MQIAQIPENLMKIPVMVEKARVSSLEGVIIGKEGRDKLTRLLNGADVVATVESFVNGRYVCVCCCERKSECVIAEK